MSNNLSDVTGSNMADHNKTSAHIDVTVPVNGQVTLGPEVLCTAAGTMDPGHNNFKNIEITAAHVHNPMGKTNTPVGIVIGDGVDNKLLATKSRVLYGSHAQAVAGANAKMVHAVIKPGAPAFKPVSLPLEERSKADIELENQKATARLTRWQCKPGDVTSEEGHPVGSTPVTNATTGQKVHLVPVHSEDHPFSKFVTSNMDSKTFMGGAYTKGKRTEVEHNNATHIRMTDEHVNEATKALVEHLTPTGHLCDGVTISCPALDHSQGTSNLGNAHVSLTIERDPLGEVKAEGLSAVLPVASSGDDSDVSVTQAKLQALAFGEQ